MVQREMDKNRRLGVIPPVHIGSTGSQSRSSIWFWRKESPEWWLYVAILVITDLVLTYVAFRLAYMLRFNTDLPIFFDVSTETVPFYNNVMAVVIPLWLVIFGAMGLYSRQNLLGGTKEYAFLFNATTLGMFLLITARFTFPDSMILARGWVILAWLLTFLFVGMGRFILRRVVYITRKHGYFRHRALIVGVNEEGLLLSEQLHQNPTSGFNVLGFITTHNTQPSDNVTNGLPMLGSVQDLRQVIQQHKVKDLILSSSALSQEQVLSIFQEFGTEKDLDLYLSSGLYEIITTGLQVRDTDSVPLVVINKVRLKGVDQVFKTIMDYAIAVPLVILLLPVFAIIALLVRLDSPGPIIYRRRVMGINNTQFDAFKFRTMAYNSDEILKSDPKLMQEYLQNFKIKEDPRITRIGRFIRKASIDELPQLWNVIRGEMSIVGPRMITPEELQKYNQWGMNLLTVKPGITGYWQVHGRSDVSYEERVRMDMYYIRNWTIWMDLQLLIQTAPAVLSKRGAY